MGRGSDIQDYVRGARDLRQLTLESAVDFIKPSVLMIDAGQRIKQANQKWPALPNDQLDRLLQTRGCLLAEYQASYAWDVVEIYLIDHVRQVGRPPGDTAIPRCPADAAK